MIVLDTNIISECMRPEPEPSVMEWIGLQPLETLFLPAIVVAELRYGVSCMPEGKRLHLATLRLEGEILPRFVNRILSFDLAATAAYAELRARARAVGLAISGSDGYIAATAAANRMAVATRDVSPFEAAGVPVINPWESAH